MAKSLAARAAPARVEDDALLPFDAPILTLDEVAERRERLLAYVEATRAVVVYRFMLPEGASVAGLGASGAPRDARDQLHLLVGLIGGSLTRSPGGLAARVSKLHAGRFEALAWPLIEAYLVSLDLGEAT
jgi:hypothetical protein